MGKNSAGTILRWGLAFVFFYAAVSSLLKPEDWPGYFPQFLQNQQFSHLFLVSFAAYEIILAVFLFLGKKLMKISLIAAITFGAIVVLNLGALDTVFLDVGLLMAALALYEIVKGAKVG